MIRETIALTVRELKHWYRNKIQIFMMLIQPIVWLGLFGQAFLHGWFTRYSCSDIERLEQEADAHYPDFGPFAVRIRHCRIGRLPRASAPRCMQASFPAKRAALQVGLAKGFRSRIPSTRR